MTISHNLYDELYALNKSELRMVSNLIRDRLRDLEAAHVVDMKPSLTIGAPVRMCGNLSPKYLIGLTGTIAGPPRGQRIDIKWDHPRYARRYSGDHQGGIITVPLTCIELIA